MIISYILAFLLTRKLLQTVGFGYSFGYKFGKLNSVEICIEEKTNTTKNLTILWVS